MKRLLTVGALIAVLLGVCALTADFSGDEIIALIRSGEEKIRGGDVTGGLEDLRAAKGMLGSAIVAMLPGNLSFSSEDILFTLKRVSTRVTEYSHSQYEYIVKVEIENLRSTEISFATDFSTQVYAIDPEGLQRKYDSYSGPLDILSGARIIRGHYFIVPKDEFIEGEYTFIVRIRIETDATGNEFDWSDQIEHDLKYTGTIIIP